MLYVGRGMDGKRIVDVESFGTARFDEDGTSRFSEWRIVNALERRSRWVRVGYSESKRRYYLAEASTMDSCVAYSTMPTALDVVWGEPIKHVVEE